MARVTPRPPPTQTLVLSCLNHRCPVCAGPLWFAYENFRKITTLDAVLGLTLQIRRCVNPACEGYHRPYRPESEGRFALPHHEFGLDVMAWIGAQRYQACCSLPEIHRDLQAQGVIVAARTVDNLLARYEELVSVALEAPARRVALRQQGRLILALDGLQPDKGHEVLWVIRDVLSGEILLARSLLVSGQEELSGLLREALVGLEGIPIQGVISDGQHAIRQAVANSLPGVPHQLCQFHYLREAGRPIWEADRHAQKELRQRVRGVRAMERQVEERTDPEAAITREYCAAVRGALSDTGQPPLEAGGLQLQQRLSLIETSLNRVAPKAFWGRFSAKNTKNGGDKTRFRRAWCHSTQELPHHPAGEPLMACHPRIIEWATRLQIHLPHLSKPQIKVLALWSLGMVLARSCALTAVSACLAPWLGHHDNTLRQRLREFCYEARAKRGKTRQAVVVESCFAPLLAWVLSLWEGTQLALALDATPLGTRFTVLVISVVYRGCALPIAWTVLTANVEKAWRPEWLRMLRLLSRAVPPTWTVIVLADRGLYARWLFRRITRLGWHPFLRINTGGTFRPTGEQQRVPLQTLVPRPGCQWSGTGLAFKGRQRRLRCTLLARWEAGYQDPWLIVTDLPPAVGEVGWYGLRAWIEQGFKRTKRGGWQWQQTRMTDPTRAARLWLAIAVATLWLVSVGGEADETLPVTTLPDLATALPPPPRSHQAAHLRLVSVFRRGWNLILAALLNQSPLPHGRLVPEPWPTRPPRHQQGTIPPIMALLQAA